MEKRKLLSSDTGVRKQDLYIPKSSSGKRKVRFSRDSKMGEINNQRNKITKYIEKSNKLTRKFVLRLGDRLFR